MRDKYENFAQLAQNEKTDEDFTIICRELDSELAVLAPHGGGIEPGTVDVADFLAGCDHSFYAFKALKKKGNRLLHITSNRFDEPLGVMISQKARISIAIHGSHFKKRVVDIGGRHPALKQEIQTALSRAGFNARISDVPGLRGIMPENICNRCQSGKGVQIEISRGLRETMFEHLTHRRLRKKTLVFYQFVRAVEQGLSSSEFSGPGTVRKDTIMKCAECGTGCSRDDLFSVDNRKVCRKCLFGNSSPVSVYPIGIVKNNLERDHTPFGRKGTDTVSEIELLPSQKRFMSGLDQEIEITIVYYLHQSRSVRTLFNRGLDGKRVGVFASRSPDRLSKIGIQNVRLLDVTGTTLSVEGLDAVSGTPVLDIKLKT